MLIIIRLSSTETVLTAFMYNSIMTMSAFPAAVRRIVGGLRALFHPNRSNGDASTKIGTNMPWWVLFPKPSLATQNSKMVAIFFKMADFSDKIYI